MKVLFILIVGLGSSRNYVGEYAYLLVDISLFLLPFTVSWVAIVTPGVGFVLGTVK